MSTRRTRQYIGCLSAAVLFFGVYCKKTPAQPLQNYVLPQKQITAPTLDTMSETNSPLRNRLQELYGLLDPLENQKDVFVLKNSKFYVKLRDDDGQRIVSDGDYVCVSGENKGKYFTAYARIGKFLKGKLKPLPKGKDCKDANTFMIPLTESFMEKQLEGMLNAIYHERK